MEAVKNVPRPPILDIGIVSFINGKKRFLHWQLDFKWENNVFNIEPIIKSDLSNIDLDNRKFISKLGYYDIIKARVETPAVI